MGKRVQPRAEPADPLVVAIETSYARGDFSTLRKLAKQASAAGGAAHEAAERYMRLVRIDPVALATGVGTLAVVIVAAILSLR